MKVNKIVTKTEPTEIRITGATLLSKEEYEKYKNNIPPRNYWWWLRSPGLTASYASIVSGNGHVLSDGLLVSNSLYAVVPALQIHNLKSFDFKTGDKFEFGGHMFTILGKGYALCDDFIGRCTFREDYEAANAGDYEASDVKRYVDEWFERSYKECGTDLHKPSEDKESAGISETALERW